MENINKYSRKPGELMIITGKSGPSQVVSTTKTFVGFEESAEIPVDTWEKLGSSMAKPTTISGTGITLAEYRRWLLFSGRLAENGFRYWRKSKRRELKEVVLRCIDIVRSNHGLDGIDCWDGVIGQNVDRLLWDWGYIGETTRGEEKYTAIGSATMACIRAGADVAISPSAGVIGFDVGCLRRMFPRGLPAWVQSFFEQPIGIDVSDGEKVWL